MKLPGIDVSNHQGVIDWQAVKNAGIRFAFMKATECLFYHDAYFEANWNACQKVGIVRGAYHFAQPQNDAVEQAAVFCESVLPLAPGDMLALDLECGEGDLADWTYKFLSTVEFIAQVKPLLYANRWFMNSHSLTDNPELAKYSLWLASWTTWEPPTVSGWDKLAFWQQSSDGVLAGIKGPVDFDFFLADNLADFGYKEPAIDPGGDVLTDVQKAAVLDHFNVMWGYAGDLEKVAAYLTQTAATMTLDAGKTTEAARALKQRIVAAKQVLGLE